MKAAIRFYQVLNKLSIDVAFGAMVCSAFFASLYAVTVDSITFVCLGISVWLIYTVDHLLDAKIIKESASTNRHRFHQEYFNLVMWVAIGFLAVLLVLLSFIDLSVLYGGSILSSVVVLYFLVQRRLTMLKEMLGAILYTTGVLLPVFTLSKDFMDILFSGPVILFFATALVNLVLFSWFDNDTDLQDKQPSIANTIGERSAKGVIYFLFMLFIIAAGVLSHAESFRVILVFATMNSILFLIFLCPNWFAQNDRYRMVGDAVFFIPLIHFL